MNVTDDNMTALIDALPFPVLVIGPDERVKASNGALRHILGDDLLGRHHITALRQPGVLDAIASVWGGQSPVITRYLGRDGAHDTSYRVVVARAADDIVVTFEDQTASEEAGKMRRDFVANVSHELRTPLTALLGFIETLGGAARDDAAARDRFLKIMTHEASRMTRLVDDLLSLSRVEEDERIRPRAPVDIGALMQSVIKGLEPQAAAAGATVTLKTAPEATLVPGDAGQLVQVFSNLIENALKYGAKGGVVSVTLSAPDIQPRLRGPGVIVTVQDQGEGIASHHIARLTERFYRVDNHRSREVGGTGLGLAIVKHIVNRHRGRLMIESTVGQGTRIAVVLPSE